MLHVHAIAEVDAQRRGIHVLFAGPTSWMYAPGGWTLERRQWQEPKAEPVCVTLSGDTLASLHRERELDTAIGTATLRDGTWLASAGSPPGTAEVLTIDLHEPAPYVRVAMPGPNWTTYALWHRKVVATAPPQTQAGEVLLSATAIDAVVIHAQHADSWKICAMHDAAGDIGWTTIAKLQLPVREVDGSLADANAEWAVAKSRLIAGDALAEPGFAEIADALRPLAADNLVRPIDWSTVPDPGSPDSVSGALDPLRIALLDPIVRRALGQG